MHPHTPYLRHTLLPGLRPTVVTHRIPQRQERIHAQSAPMHPRTLQARLDHEFVGTLNHSTADWPALGLKPRILHLRHALLQIGQVLGPYSSAGLPGGEAAQAL